MDTITTKESIRNLLIQERYVPDETIVTSLFLSQLLKKPLLVEGPAGVGKTEIAKSLARSTRSKLIRLQCYEGLDANHAIYEWNYSKQMLFLKMIETSDWTLEEKENKIYGGDFLMARPLLESITQEKPPVLLIDELDRADEEFESYLLELLSDWQITIPETGTIKAKSIPAVIVTSNRNRELSEALRRRCIYLWIDFPSLEKEKEIIYTKVPEIDRELAGQISLFMQEIRQLRLEKKPGIAETLDWAHALAGMHVNHLDMDIVASSLGVIIKDWEDMRESQLSLKELFEKTGIISKPGL